MKTLLTILSVLTLSLSASAQSLEGQWAILGNEAPEALVRFISVDGNYFAHTKETVVFPNGNLSHTIDQSVKLSVKDGKIEGTVDFFDSRGCSYRDYKVSGEFRSQDEASLVMTIPRYKLVTITTGPTGHYYYDRPIYCWGRSHYYPYRSYRYICGYDQAIRSTRTECRLVDTVQVPVALGRY